MVFLTSIAGPSTRRYSIHAAASLARHASTQATEATETSPEVVAELDDKDSRHARQKEKLFYGTKGGYQAWLKTGAASEFYDANKGQRARWLDQNVPYTTNPSFRPPPPLSNELQTTIYRHLRRRQKTVGQLAEQYNVSKARIEAIRKLKQVEDEFRKQGLPLQQAFHDGMEPLLGVERQSKQAEDLPGTVAEREEEERLDAGIGRAGAFGGDNGRREGLEKPVWEFRSEEMVMAERQAEAKAAAGVETEAEKKVAELEVAPETPNAKVEVVEETKASPSRVAKVGKTKYRFVDTSNV